MRRLKIFPVDERALVDILSCWKGGSFITLPSAPRIPEGARLVSAWHDPASRTLNALIEHESFPEVPDGDIPPRGDFVDYEALERIPVASQFQPSQLLAHLDPYGWPGPTYRWQSDIVVLPSGRGLEIEYLDGESRSPIARYIPKFAGPQAVRDKTLRLRERDLTRIMDGEVPGGRFSPQDMGWILWCFTPAEIPKITALERWLTVANTEKYTVGSQSSPERQALLKKAADKFGPQWMANEKRPVLGPPPNPPGKERFEGVMG